MSTTEGESSTANSLLSEDDEPPSRPAAIAAPPAAPHAPLQETLGKPDARGSLRPAPRPRRRMESPAAVAFRRRYFRGVTAVQWNDWQWQMRNRLRTLADLQRVLVLSDEERHALADVAAARLPVSIPPYYAALLDRHDPADPLRRTVVPTPAERRVSPGEADDPLGEDGHSPTCGLVHRYPDRVLLLANDTCAAYCRYCTRCRTVGCGRIVPSRSRFEAALAYIRQHAEVRDVLISGGDPLMLSDEKLEWLIGSLRAIPHVEMVRLGTKVPAVLPQRITARLCAMLRNYHPLWMSLHFTHPAECTPETTRACGRLADAGIPLGSQTVLLAGVNDEPAVMKDLMHGLLRMRVRPYYLYQCDPITGSAHFRTPVARGLEILQRLRGHTTGYGVPTFVIDAPGGGGKIPLQADYRLGRDGQDVLLRNYEGKRYRYPDRAADAKEPPCESG